ncbi:MAG: hypothetical protein SXA11_15090 [Cyanobacteriota bacterium]|nr:hypothetical protein [Cyanobacteriota bacterium]
MQFAQLLGRLLFYIIGGLAYIISAAIIVGIAITAKIVAVEIADRLLYSIIVFGDLLRGIEIVELFNIVVFALVGMGFGLATGFLPSNIGRKLSAVFLIVLVPIIFMTTQVVRYDLWLNEVANNENIPIEGAARIANDFLQERVGEEGIIGFYVYTGQFPILPTNKKQMKEVFFLENNANSKFVKVTGVPPGIISFAMSLCFWLIRGFYFLVAVVSTIGHFREGAKIAKR